MTLDSARFEADVMAYAKVLREVKYNKQVMPARFIKACVEIAARGKIRSAKHLFRILGVRVNQNRLSGEQLSTLNDCLEKSGIITISKAQGARPVDKYGSMRVTKDWVFVYTVNGKYLKSDS